MLSFALCTLPFVVLLSMFEDSVGMLKPEVCGICRSWGGGSVIFTIDLYSDDGSKSER